VVGVGGANAPSGNLSGRLVFAMRVEEVLTLEEYHRRALADWPSKIPDVTSLDLAARLGDCIYDFSGSKVRPRPGVHGAGNISSDLGGKNVLLSRDFYYFGREAIPLDPDLKNICPSTQGHRSDANIDKMAAFVVWLRGLNLPTGQLHGWPDMVLKWSAAASSQSGCAARAHDDHEEEGVSAECGDDRTLHPCGSQTEVRGSSCTPAFFSADSRLPDSLCWNSPVVRALSG